MFSVWKKKHILAGFERSTFAVPGVAVTFRSNWPGSQKIELFINIKKNWYES